MRVPFLTLIFSLSLLTACAPAEPAESRPAVSDTGVKGGRLDPEEADIVEIYGRADTAAGDVVVETKDATDTASLDVTTESSGGDLETQFVTIDASDAGTAEIVVYWFDNGEDPPGWAQGVMDTLPEGWSASWARSSKSPGDMITLAVPDGSTVAVEDL
jgi:hypothetical protein